MNPARALKLGLLFVILVGPRSLRAAEAPIRVLELNPFTGIGSSLAGSFTGWNLTLHLASVAATAGVVYSGADTRVHNFFYDHRGFSPYTVPAVVGGYFVPLVAGTALATYGLSVDVRREYLAACAVLQATLIAFTYQVALKTITGREPPQPEHYANDDASRRFRWGFLRGGIDWGWPSGLLMINTAAVVSLSGVYRDSWALRLLGGLYVAAQFVSTLGHEDARLCWLSDSVAGAAMGLAIGRGVASSFANTANPSWLDRVAVAPLVSRDARGLSASVAF